MLVLHWEIGLQKWMIFFQCKCQVPYNKPWVTYALYIWWPHPLLSGLSSIKKDVILCELCLMPQTTCLVIWINNLWDLLLSACIIPVPADCSMSLSISLTLKYNAHSPKHDTYREPVFQLSFLSYRQDCLSLVLHQCLFQNHWSLHSASPSVKAANMHVILSGHSFSVIVNSPESALMKLVSSQEPLLISSELSFSLHCFIVSNSCWIGLMPTADPSTMYSSGRFHPILS